MFEIIKTTYPYYKFKKVNNAKGVIFFIHGYAVDSTYHDIFANKLVDYDYYAVEHAGHGVTPLKNKKQLNPYSFALEVTELIKQLDLNDIILIGHSMGGGIAMMVSQMIPERIKKMIIVTPMNSKGCTKVFNFLFKMNPTKEKHLKPYYKILLGDINKMDNIPTQELNDLLENQKIYKKNYKILKRRMASLSNMNKLKKYEKNLKIPTLLIVGDCDDCINAKTTSKNLRKKNINIKINKFEFCGHLPFFEYPDKYYNTIMEFINE